MIIVAVDDELLCLKRLEEYISSVKPDSELHCFLNSEFALSFAERKRIDVLFTDIHMPGLDGIELAKSIKKLHPKTNIIFCTAFSEYALDAVSMPLSGFLLKPIKRADIIRMFDDLRYPVESSKAGPLKVQCFGNFEVYYNSKPIQFGYEKTKELLAYLIDRRGAMCSNGEIMGILFEDEQKCDYLRKLKKDLTDTFEKLGIKNVIIKHYGCLGLDCHDIYCDYYSWLEGKPDGVWSYFGEYMSQYSWAEDTNARLLNM